MRKYWRPGLRVWWRAKDQAQIGVDPGHILTGINQREHTLLDAFTRSDPQLDCWTIAHQQGWKHEEYAQFLSRLPHHALVDTPTLNSTPTTRYWSVVHTTGAPCQNNRGNATIIIDGLDYLGFHIVNLSCEAGIRTVGITDPQTVTNSDTVLGPYSGKEVGQPRGERAISSLRSLHPHTRFFPYFPDQNLPSTSATKTVRGQVFNPMLRSSSNPPTSLENVDFAVVVAHGAIARHRVREYVRQEVPIVPVIVGDVDVMIGPKLSPPGPCLRCLHLHFTQTDPRWPVIATQLAATTNPSIDPMVVNLAAAITTHQITALADGRPHILHSTSLHVDGIHPIPRHQTWQPHPLCGCDIRHLAA